MISACDGSSSGGRPVDPTQAPGGGGAGPGEEPEEPEEEEGEGDELEPVPLDVCNTSKTNFAFGIQYDKVTWFGPPRVDIKGGGFYDVLGYSFDNDAFVGTFSLPQSREIELPLIITFPDCRSDPYEANVTFRARVEGTCKNSAISLTVYERWDSVLLNIPCEAESEVCGEDPCVFPYPLPFAFAGEAGITIKSKLNRGADSCTPSVFPLDFKGVGADGQKTYKLDCD